jgi:pantetheine-phosphate adenylyltransferase
MKTVKACIGGTFNHIHQGHEKLLETAFSLSDQVLIGLTSQEFALKKRKKKVKPFQQRKKRLKEFLESRGWEQKSEIVKINTEAGPADSDPELKAIVVSQETLPTAEKINFTRKQKKLPLLKIVVIPIQKDAQGRKISSSFLSTEEKK